ncbi:MAG: hypothetical protein R3F56_02820 [Planctomycetota bacterium]
MLTRFASVLFVLGSVSAVAQGRTWVIDEANGPGTDFLDLPPAEAAAADGDVFAIRAGSYHGFATTKALTLIGTPGLTKVITPMIGLPVFEVTNVPAGRTFAARDVVIQTLGMTTHVVFRNCVGPIVLQGIEDENSYFAVSLDFYSCGAVCLSACGQNQSTFDAGIGVIASASDVTIQGCRLRGQYAALDPRGLNLYAAPAVRASSGSRVFLADSQLAGGAGAHEWPFIGTYRTSAAGLDLQASSARIGLGCDIAAGSGATPTLPVPAIGGTGSIDLDPSVPLAPFGSAPPIAPTVTVTTRVVSALTASGGTLGGQVQLDLRSAPTRPFVLAVGQLEAAVPTPFGSLFLAPATMVVLGGGLQTTQGVVTFVLSVPSNPTLSGLHLAWQAATEDPLGRVDLANPAAVLLR